MMKKTVILMVLIFTLALTSQAALIHHWDFEGTADDTGTVGGADGTLEGDAAYAFGRIGQAISLDGLGDFVSTGVTSPIVPATDYTLAAWVFWDKNAADRGRIAGGQLSGNEGEVFTLSRNTIHSQGSTDRKLFLNLLKNGDQGNSITESEPNTVSTGTWMHVAYTVDSTTGTTIYLNGEIVGTNPVRTTHNPASNFAIGARPDTQALTMNPDFFDGLIDDVRLYDTVLSVTEIAGLAHSNASVYSGSDWITWSGQHIYIDDAQVANNDPNSGGLTISWSHDNPAGVSVEFSATDVLDPTVTVTKDIAAPNPTIVTLTLTVTQAGKDPVTHSMEIDVYDNVCDVTKAGGNVTIEPTDINRDCITNISDLAMMAGAWLVDYAETVPQPRL